MEFSTSDLEDFMRLWKDAFGHILTVDEARHHAARVMALYEILADRKRSSEKPDRSSP
jgi:hypothetical protein